MKSPFEPPIEIDDDFYSDHQPLFHELLTSIEWDDRMSARRTASFGRPYNYSQMEYPETPIPNALEALLLSLKEKLGIQFNNCLLNYYETGDNTMGFHSDDTTGLVSGTGVAIVSLGSVRDITYRSKIQPEIQKSFPLKPGSLLYMDDVVQEKWMHAIKKQKEAGPRISLTWRAFR
jgi:alkylated DNA repair dioxygenase AlkB